MFSALSRFGRAGAPAGRSLDAAVRALFPDVWYDPSDLTTLYQDSAGTTPVTAVEQAVGLMLDKSKGLVLGSELVANGGFDTDTGWNKSAGATISGGSLNFASVSNNQGATQGTIPAGKWYRVQFTVGSISADAIKLKIGSTLTGNLMTAAGTYTGYVYSGASAGDIEILAGGTTTATIDNISVRELPGNHAYHTPGDTTTRPVLSARVNSLVGTATLATQSVTTLATNYRLTFGGTGSVALSGTATGTYSAGTHTVTCTAGTLTLTVTGSVTNADLRPSDLAAISAYQRVTTSTDYDVSAGVYYLRCDGVNDGLQTNSIDFSGTDKMFVSAGVRKLSDAAVGMLLELSATVNSNNGSFYYADPTTPQVTEVAIRGSTGVNILSTYSSGTAPVSRVTVASLDLSASTKETALALRQNGVSTGLTGSITPAGGKFGSAYPLYLFRRGGSSLPFNGQFFGAVIKGATLTAAQIALVERYLAGKTKTVVLA